MKKLMTLILAAMLLLGAVVAAAESSEGNAILVHVEKGSVTVTDPDGNVLPVEEEMAVPSGCVVETGEDSYAYIYLDDSKVVKLDVNTVVTVSRNGGKAEVELQSGQLMFNLEAPLADGEEFIIRMPTMMTSVEGSGVVNEQKIIYGTGRGVVYQVAEDGQAKEIGTLEGGQAVSVNEESGEVENTEVQADELPAIYLKEADQNEALQEALESEGNFEVSELIAQIPAAEAAEEAAREEAKAAAAKNNVAVNYVPVVPAAPAEPEEPAEPEKPVEPEKPAEPEEPVEPEKPAEPEEPKVETRTVTWKNGDTVLKTEMLADGSEPKYTGDEPAKAADAQYTYTFAGWEPAIAPVKEDVTYTAKFTAVTKDYAVTFVDEDGTVLKAAAEYEYGTAADKIEKPADPVKAATAEYTYTFAGWEPAVAEVSGNATYKAVYTAKKNAYTVSFVDEDGTALKAAEYEYGTAADKIEKPAPVKAATAEYTYTFAGWEPAVAEVAGNATYKAVYTAKKNTCAVTFVDEDGTTVLKAAEYEYGTAADEIEKPADPVKAEAAEYTYTFAGWEPAVAEVTGNATYTATYTSEKKCEIVWKQADGTALTTTYAARGEKPVYPGANPVQASAYSAFMYEFRGWTPEITDATGDAEYTACFELVPDPLIEPPVITISFASTEKPYGGSSLDISDCLRVSADGYPDGFAVKATCVLTSNTDAGNEIAITKDMIQVSVTFNGKDMTDYYKRFVGYSLENASLKITKMKLDIWTGDASKVYDNNDPDFVLTCDEASITENPDGITVTATGSQTGLGTRKNTYKINWGSANQDNYVIDEHLGELRIYVPATATIDENTMKLSFGDGNVYSLKNCSYQQALDLLNDLIYRGWGDQKIKETFQAKGWI